jgi:hypothetical protein
VPAGCLYFTSYEVTKERLQRSALDSPALVIKPPPPICFSMCVHELSRAQLIFCLDK